MARSRDEYYTGSGEQRNLNSREFERGLAAALEEFDKREAARKGGAAGTVATSSSVSSKKSLDATPEPESSPPSPTSPPSLLSSQTPTSSLLPPTLTVGPIIPTTPTGGDSGVGGGGKTSGKQSPAGKPSSPKKTGGGPTTMKEPPASPGRESGDDYPDLRLRMPKEIQTLYEYIQFLTDKEVEHDIITKLNTELETLGHPPLHGNVKKKESIISILKGLYKPSTGEKKTKSRKGV
jgi:hypothetical protein